MVKRNPPARPWRVFREREIDPRQGYEMAKQYLGEDLWRQDDQRGNVDVGPFLRAKVIHADGIDVLDVRWCYRDKNDDGTETHHGMQVPLNQLEELSRLIQAAAEQYTKLGE